MGSVAVRGAAVLVAVAALAACGGEGRPAARGTEAPGTGSAPSTAPSGAAPSGKPGVTPPAGSATALPPSSGSSVAPPGTSASPPARPQHTPSQASATEIPIDASVTPACVAPGGVATLRVVTLSKASVGYVAVYSNGKSGAVPPWGEGYGGNEAGQTDSQGTWTARWTVRADAPRGAAHAMLVVAHSGKQRRINVPFSVGVREVGGCGTP